MTYRNLVILIENKRYEKEDMLNKLDLFLLRNRITEDEYNLLSEMIEKSEAEKLELINE